VRAAGVPGLPHLQQQRRGGLQSALNAGITIHSSHIHALPVAAVFEAAPRRSATLAPFQTMSQLFGNGLMWTGPLCLQLFCKQEARQSCECRRQCHAFYCNTTDPSAGNELCNSFANWQGAHVVALQRADAGWAACGNRPAA
jgi:hypothetical protein